MKKLRWGRIISILIILVLVGAMLNYCVRYMTSDESSEEIAPASSQTTQKIENKTLSNSQKREMIEKARKQAIEAALATGQTEVDAKQFGQLSAQEVENSLNVSADIHE